MNRCTKKGVAENVLLAYFSVVREVFYVIRGYNIIIVLVTLLPSAAGHAVTTFPLTIITYFRPLIHK